MRDFGKEGEEELEHAVREALQESWEDDLRIQWVKWWKGTE